jgi:hypothetical protein
MKPLKQLIHRLLDSCGFKVMKNSAHTDLIRELEKNLEKRFDFLQERIAANSFFLKEMSLLGTSPLHLNLACS